MAAQTKRIVVVGLVLIACVFLAPVVSAADAQRTFAPEAALSAHLGSVDDALARRDIAAASQELQAAYQVALASRRWQGMIAYGDTALRVAEVAGSRQTGVEQARRAYLIALYRARSESSVEGALAATHSFVLLGDREFAQGCLSVARRLARTPADRARVRELAARLDDRLAAIPGF